MGVGARGARFEQPAMLRSWFKISEWLPANAVSPTDYSPSESTFGQLNRLAALGTAQAKREQGMVERDAGRMTLDEWIDSPLHPRSWNRIT
jgi:hypothetical protein